MDSTHQANLLKHQLNTELDRFLAEFDLDYASVLGVLDIMRIELALRLISDHHTSEDAEDAEDVE